MKKYLEISLNIIEIWRNKDEFKTRTPIFTFKIPYLGGDAFSRDIGGLLSKNTDIKP